MATWTECEECGSRRMQKNSFELWMHSGFKMTLCAECFPAKVEENVEAQLSETAEQLARIQNATDRQRIAKTAAGLVAGWLE